MESVNFNKNQPQRIRVPAVEETFKMANKPWSMRTLCFPLSHLSCSTGTVLFFPCPLCLSFCLSLCPTSFSRLFLFSKQGSLYRKLCILESFRKAESRFPVGAMVTKKKKGERKRERVGGGLGERGSVMSELLKKKQTLIPLPSPRSSALPFAKSSDISSLHSTAAR